jgi:hypothetical protein
MEPPELDRPFTTERERTEALSTFLDACIALQTWLDTARANVSMSPDQRQILSMRLESGDSPEQKLGRWANLFDDELKATLDVRNRIVHGMAVPDRDLRGCTWLARRLLSYLEPATAA